MGLRFDPIGGGRFKQVVQQLIEIERQPIKKLEQRKEIENTKLKLFQEFKTKFTNFDSTLAEFSNRDTFRELKVELGDGEDLMNVTIDKTKAQPGSYSIKINELAARSSIMSNGFTDPNKPVIGIGFVVVNLPNGDKWELYVDEKDSSLYGIANAINNVPETPIRAVVVKDGSDPEKPWKLIVNSTHDGWGRGVEFPEFYFLDGDEHFWTDDWHEAWNALVEINDFEIETESNDVPNFLPGVNVLFKGARPDRAFMMAITEDTKKIAEKMKGLVDQVNGVLEFIQVQNKVDEKSDTRTMFTGDSGLQSIEYRIRNQLHEGFPVGEYNSDDFKLVWLSEMGIEIKRDGLIGFDENKFTQAMENNYTDVQEAIAGELGFAHQLRQVISQYTSGSQGFLTQREKGLRSRITQIDTAIEDKERQVDRKTQALTQKFSRLQSSLANLQQQQQYMQANLGGGGGGNLVSQLLGG